MTTSKNWISIEKFLPEKFDIDYDEKVRKIIEYIKERRETLIYEGKNPEQSYVFLSPVSDESDGIGSAISDFNVGKFLVLLKRTGVIENLHLPIFIQETQNKEIISVRSSTPVWLSPELAVRESLETPKEFRRKIPRFQIKNWDKFLEAVKGLQELEKKKEIAKYSIRKTALQNMAIEIKELVSHSGLEDFFSDLNIPKELYADGSKYDKVFSVLSGVNQEILFRIIEEAMHPLRFFNGDEEKAAQMQDLFSSFLQYDGYCIYNGKVIKTTPETLGKIKIRIEERKEKQTDQSPSDNGIISTKEPLPIRIVGDIGIRGFEEKVILQKPKNKRIQLRKFPADTKWNNITIRFLNDHEVIIKVKDETHQATYEVMGFQDEKKKLPNKQWQFLMLLAFKNGEISWENNRDLSSQQINSIKKQKQLLTEALKTYFQIYDDEPFYDYKKEKAYKIKINLVPESNTKKTPNEQEIFREDDELGIKKAYKEQTPEIYEE
ncbi:MAG: hypothetical protein PHQ76_01510 [Caldisericia bacterium]|nr:hypothetical protein [Caldisericia bacterium]